MKKLAPAWLMFCAIVLALVVFDRPASAQLVPANPSVNGMSVAPSSVDSGVYLVGGSGAGRLTQSELCLGTTQADGTCLGARIVYTGGTIYLQNMAGGYVKVDANGPAGSNVDFTSAGTTPASGNFVASGGNGYFSFYNANNWGWASTGGASFGEYSGGTLVRTVSSNVDVMNVPITAPNASNTGCRAMDGGSQTIALQTTGMHCFCQDQTTKTNDSNCPVSSTTATISATTSDLICYFCF